MSSFIECNNCKDKVAINTQPVICYACPMGHVLCESCNDVARAYCFRCGGKTTRKIPDKGVKELFKLSPEFFKNKLEQSRMLILTEESDITLVKPTPKVPPTVIGFRKWPRTFFHTVPDANSSLHFNGGVLQQMIPNIVEDEPSPMEPIGSSAWDNLPRQRVDFEMSSEILECPITSCRYPILNTDATRHLLQSHQKLPIEILGRHGMGNFTLNISSARKNEIKALLRILVPGIVKDLGDTDHKDCLPLYLLYTRVNLVEAEEELKKINNTHVAVYSVESEKKTSPTLESCDDEEYIARNPWKTSDCLLIWCAGIVPLNFPLKVSISVNAYEEKFKSLGALVKVFSLHLPQSSFGIYSTTEHLMITRPDFNRLATNGSSIDGQVCITW